MKTLKFIAAAIALAALASGADVSAHTHGGGHWHGHDGHWHGHIGLFVGVPLGAALYPYYPPDVVAVPSPQVVYVERNPTLPAGGTVPLPAGWWYYCPNPAGYYPYVQSCFQPWQPVEPRPPAP